MPPAPPAVPDRVAVLVRALTTDPPEIAAPDVPALLAAGLAGEVRSRLSPGHPLREALRGGHLALGARHAAIRAELRPLLAAWARDGTAPLLFKGFALAEFVYATPGERFYGDVDVLLPEDPGVLTRAVHVALAHGWRSDGLHALPERWTHEAAHLYSPSGRVRLELHRAVVPGDPALARRLTQAVWTASREQNWEGVPVRLPAPADALIVGLALSRVWGDGGHLKPADYADTRRLLAESGLNQAELEVRARELGVTHTWAAFREACWPPEGHLRLGADPAPRREVTRRDGQRPRAALWGARATLLRRRARWMLRLLPDALAAFLAVRAGGDPRRPLARWTPAVPPTPLPLDTLSDVVGAAAWLTRLLYPRQSRVGTCVPRAYTTYRALRRLGHPAVFVSGVARVGGGVQGHAWVEDHRGGLDAYGEPLNRVRFRESFSFPAG
nr:lasso peptide biosynthesis B2 protein [Deinococcus sp. HSC-46F16]